MGGTIRRLMQQGHDVHIAYETSGNIAVADEEVRLYMHFINGFNQLFANGSDEVIKIRYQEIMNYLRQKKEGDLDNQSILTVKGLIRRGRLVMPAPITILPKTIFIFWTFPSMRAER